MWRKWIKYKGIRWVADRIEVNQETVRGWANDGLKPKDVNKLKLVKLCKGEFTIVDFYK